MVHNSGIHMVFIWFFYVLFNRFWPMDTGPGEPGPVKYTRSLLGLGALVDEFVVLKTRHHFSMFAEFPELLMDYLWMIYGIFMDYLWLFGSRFFFWFLFSWGSLWSKVGISSATLQTFSARFFLCAGGGCATASLGFLGLLGQVSI